MHSSNSKEQEVILGLGSWKNLPTKNKKAKTQARSWRLSRTLNKFREIKRGECISVAKELEIFMAQMENELASLVGSGSHNLQGKFPNIMEYIYF